MAMAKLNANEEKLQQDLMLSVAKIINDKLKENGQDPNIWKQDPPMTEYFADIIMRVGYLIYRIAEIREHSDQFGKW